RMLARAAGSPPPRPETRRNPFRPKVEALEERWVPAAVALNLPPLRIHWIVQPQGHTSGLGPAPVVADTVTPAGTVIATLDASAGPDQRYLNHLRGPFDDITGTLQFHGTEIPHVGRKLHKVKVKLVQDPLNPLKLDVVLVKDFTFDRSGELSSILWHPEQEHH